MTRDKITPPSTCDQEALPEEDLQENEREELESPSSKTLMDNECLHQLASLVRAMPYLEPPPSVLPAVMDAIHRKKMSWWCAVKKWARSPRSITFTPLQIAPAAFALAVMCFLSAAYLLKGGNTPSFQSETWGHVPIVLTFDFPGASSVNVVGTFNDWAPPGYEMHSEKGQSRWTLTLWLPGGRYEYAFVVDGRKIVPDPRAAFHQDDGFGNQNSVLIVGNPDEKTI